VERREFIRRSGIAAAGLAAAGLRLNSAAAGTLVRTSPAGSPPASTAVTDGVLGPLSVTDAKCLWGVHVQSNDNDKYKSALTRLESLVSRKFATHRRNYPWKHPLTTELDQALARDGRLPLVSWLARDKNGGAMSWKHIASGAEDAWIRKQAQDARSFGKRIYLIFHHEPENEPGLAADYRAAYRHIHSIFENVGTPNVTWILTLMAVTYKGANGGGDRWYPGDFIDMLGGDGYNWYPSRPWKKWVQFEGIFRGLHEYGQKKKRPIYVVETGCQEQTDCGHSGGDGHAKADWFFAAGDTIKSWQSVRAISYSNTTHSKEGCDTDWRFDSSKASLVAYKAVGLGSYFM
jgi:hypothetical protein